MANTIIRKDKLGNIKAGEFFERSITTGVLSLGYWWNIGAGDVCYREGVSFFKRGSPTPFSSTKYLQPQMKEISVNVIEAPELKFDNIGYLGRTNHMTGADPEVFVVKGPKQSILPAYRFLPKKNEAEIDYAYRDGFAAELKVRAQGCHSWVVDSMQAGLKDALTRARQHDPTANLSCKSAILVPRTIMATAKDEDIELGCLPSLNVYGDLPIRTENPREIRQRFAGGHIHFGIGGGYGYGTKAGSKDKVNDMVKACDIMVALPAVGMFASFDVPARRQFYGRAGEYRLPAHGLEYRVLSNAWLSHPALAHLFLNLGRVGLKIGYNGYLKQLKMEEEKVREIINTCDWQEARKWVLKNTAMFVTLLRNDGVAADDRKIKKLFTTLVEKGVEAVVDPNEMEKNWMLKAGWVGHSEGKEANVAHLCNSRW